MNKGVNYSMFYDILLNLREDFHSYGRIDDSNAKLDEMIKLICTSYSMALSGMQFSLEHIRQVALSHFGNQDMVAAALRYVCENEMQKELFCNADGTNIFGSNPTLAIQPTENDFAQKLIIEIEKIDFVYLIQNRSYSDFDLVNECFGHFVRDNFRNNKEDAQYMTPYEISEAILDIIFDDMQRRQYFDEDTLRTFTVMDPTCGVGTLLIESSSHFTKYVENHIPDENKRTEIIGRFRSSGILGQDKVDRMVRLSKLHINADCTIDFDEVEKFNPVSKGRKCYPEELIFSKINPRIPRMAVIPYRNTDLVCSNEFEIMRSRGVIGMYALCFLLKTKNVMSQIENLTSGTSSSHNRIKREQLADILIPIPVSEEAKKLVAEVDRELEAAVKLIYTAESKISDKFAVLNNI